MSESHGLGTLGAEPPLQLSCSFTLSLLDEAAHVLVTLRASFADRTLAWVSSWGRKKLISAPFLFYPQRFFEVGQSQGFPSRGAGKLSSLGKTSMPGPDAPQWCQAPHAREPRLDQSGWAWAPALLKSPTMAPV